MQSGLSQQLAIRLLLVIPVVFGVGDADLSGVPGVRPRSGSRSTSPPQADEQLRQKIRTELGFDKSIPGQYGIFLGDLAQGDLGESTITGRPVTTDLWDRLPATVELALFSMVFAVVVGIPLGVIAGAKRDGPVDFSVRGTTLIGMALPSFWLGLVLILVLFVQLGWLPGPVGRFPLGADAPDKITGLYTLDSLLRGDFSMWWESFRHLILPGITLGVVIMAPITRVARASMVEVMNSEYIRTPKSARHQQRGPSISATPSRTLCCRSSRWSEPSWDSFSPGAVLVESVFNWPGMGKYGLDAIVKSDFTALQGFVIVASVAYIVAFLLVDVV